MADYPSPSATNVGDPGNIEGYQAKQPPVMTQRQPKQIIDGSRWINSNAPGKMNENRSTTLRPQGKQKRPGNK